MIYIWSKRFLSIVLPITLLCVFGTCVLVCENVHKEEIPYETQLSTAGLQADRGCEDCPLNSFPRAALSQRRCHLDSQAQVSAPNLVCSSESLSTSEVCLLPSDLLRPAVDPPLKRLPSLRI